MTTVTVLLRPLGRGGWAPISLSYDPRLRTEQPTAVEWYRGQRVKLGELVYRVAKVETN